MNVAPEIAAAPAWPTAARLIARWLDRRERIDALLDTLPRSLAGSERARCQHLVLGVVRHFGRIDAALARLVAHQPRFSTRAVLFVAGFELLEAASATDDPRAGRVAKIVHHAVEQTKALASPAEARLVNAVVRKLAGVLPKAAPATDAGAGELAEFFSHPEWLVRSWLAQFGPEATRALLEWNQQPAPVYARWRPSSGNPSTTAGALEDSPERCAKIRLSPDIGGRSLLAGDSEKSEPAESPASKLLPQSKSVCSIPATGTGDIPEAAPAGSASVPDFLKPTRWPGFYEVESGRWPEVEPVLKSGRIYLQDPATRLPVDLLAPKPGENVLDLCAAPGGKSLLIADRMRPEGTAAPAGQLVAVDLPGTRIERLKSNLSRAEGVKVALVQADLLEDLGSVLRAHRLPLSYAAVLIDVPCTNTGVMRHRVDVKWRLQAGD
ncbi:MAG: hypothetical protein HY736_22930, partial [Verrucomicrobia bacterium]|nr:hypothetical protein [Verrucomicrobiota bacterium]